MMRRLRVAGLSLAFLSLAMLVVSAQAGTAKPQSGKVKQTASPVQALAIDGPRVAYISHGRAHVWNVSTGVTSTVKGKYPSNGKHSASRLAVDDEVAIAGKRVALITRFAAGNSEETQERLYTAPVGGTARQLGKLTDHTSVPEECDAPPPPGTGYGASGDWLGGLVGSGNVLAVSRWQADGTSPTETTDERLDLIAPTKLRTIASGPGVIVSQSTNGGHIAVLRSTEAWAEYQGPLVQSTPMVGIYSSSGALLGEVALAPLPVGYCGAPSGLVRIALSGNRLVVLRQETETSQAGSRTTTVTVDVYDWATGALVHTWPLAAPSADGLFVSGRIAVIEGKLRLLDLATGKTAKIAASRANNPATIGSRGLVYAVNTYPGKLPGHGKLVFVPTAKLLAALNK